MAKGAANSDNARYSMRHPRAFVRAERERNRRRLPIASIPTEARESFRCERWACSLSRWTCALRWIEAHKQDADAGFFRCRNCPVGQQHADLVRRQTSQ